MSNATDTSPQSQPPHSALERAASQPAASAKHSAQHPERENPQNPGHAVDATHTPTGYTGPPCPDWCDPARHDDDLEADGTITRYHHSAPTEVSGFGTLAIVQCVRAGRVDPVTLSIDPGGWAELESREEARTFAVDVEGALWKMITLAWHDAEADRDAKVLTIVESIASDVLPHYVDLFQAEIERRAASTVSGHSQPRENRVDGGAK